MDSIKISIVVPVYNVEKYLRECIDSVLSQTFSNFELLLINDGSKDDSGAICEEYAQLDSRVRVVHKKNGGLSSARNAGIELSKGKYIIFLDSDDYWIGNNNLNYLYELAENNEVDVVRGEYISVDEDGEQIKTITKEKKGINLKLMDSVSFYTQAIAGENFSVLFLYRKDALGKLRFNEELTIQEDIDFNIRFLSDSHRCLYTDTIFYVYRKRAYSITTLPQIDKLKDAFYICDVFEKYSYITKDSRMRAEYQKQSVLKYLRTLSSMVEEPYYSGASKISMEIGLNDIYIKTIKRLITYKVVNRKSLSIMCPPLLYLKILHLKIFISKKTLCKMLCNIGK